jgi:hypothetical protein
MQSVLDVPVPPHNSRDLGTRPRVARQVVVAGTGPLTAHLPLPVHQHHRRRVRPPFRHPRRVVDDRHVPLLMSPVALLNLLVPVKPEPGEIALTCLVEHRLDGRPQGRLVVLDGQQVVPLLLADDPGVLDLASGRVDRHDGPGQVQRPEQFGDRGDLIGTVRDRRRPEDRAILGGPRRDHVQAPRGRIPLGPPGRLPIDGDRDQAGRLARRRRPPAEGLGERPGVELGEHPLERVRAGDAVVEREELAEEVGLGPPVSGDRLP